MNEEDYSKIDPEDILIIENAIGQIKAGTGLWSQSNQRKRYNYGNGPFSEAERGYSGGGLLNYTGKRKRSEQNIQQVL